jgi:hypothetical protein
MEPDPKCKSADCAGREWRTSDTRRCLPERVGGLSRVTSLLQLHGPHHTRAVRRVRAWAVRASFLPGCRASRPADHIHQRGPCRPRAVAHPCKAWRDLARLRRGHGRPVGHKRPARPPRSSVRPQKEDAAVPGDALMFELENIQSVCHTRLERLRTSSLCIMTIEGVHIGDQHQGADAGVVHQNVALRGPLWPLVNSITDCQIPGLPCANALCASHDSIDERFSAPHFGSNNASPRKPRHRALSPTGISCSTSNIMCRGGRRCGNISKLRSLTTALME